VTLQSYLRILAERWKLIVLFVLLGTGIAVLVTATTPKTYQASVQLFVATSSTTSTINSDVQYQSVAFTQAQVQTFAQIVGSPDVLHRVKKDLNLNISDSSLKSELSADAPVGQSIVEVHVSDRNPNRAAAIAKSVSLAFTSVAQGYYANGKPTDCPRSRPKLCPVRLYVTDPATLPSSPESPKPVLNIVLGLLLGLLVGVGLAVARDGLDTRIKDSDKLSKAAGAPSMGVVVDDPTASKHPIATRAGPRNLRAENFRQLRANLQFANVDKHPRIIAVTSSIQGEGKTMVSINLAATLADAGFTVCLVDADLRRPTVAKALGLATSVGLTNVLIKQIDLDDALQKAGENLYVLSSGPTPPNPSEVLVSSLARDTVRSLLDRVDYVILDTAPLLPVADGSEVATLADGTLLVVRYKLTTEPQVKRAAASLARVDAKLLGVLLNRVPGRRGEYGYTYYRYEAEAEAEALAEPAPRSRRFAKGRTAKRERREVEA
jgi:capsular exopolysaccharide synthesis family protein